MKSVAHRKQRFAGVILAGLLLAGCATTPVPRSSESAAGLSAWQLNGRVSLTRGEEGWHGKVLVAAASEISTRRNYCHLVALGHATTVPRFSLTVCGAFERIRDEGGAAFLAHADGRGLGETRGGEPDPD